MGVDAYDRGETARAFDLFYKLMSEGVSKFGDSDGRTVRLYTNLGELYSQQEQFDYAEHCFKRGLNVARKGFGQNSIETVPALIDLAQMYVRTGKFALAQPLFKQALAIVDKPGDEKMAPYVVVIEADQGAMYYSAANYNFAEPHFKKASQLAATTFGATHPWSTTIGGMYASCLHAAGRAKDAKVIEQAAIAKANEMQSPITIWNKQIGLADTAMDEKKFPEAEVALKQALQAAKELSSEPMFEALTLTRQGQLLLLQNKPELAIDKWKASQAIAEMTFGLEDKVVLDRAQKLADLEASQQKYPDAEPLYLRVIANAKKQFGPESPEYAKSLEVLAVVYRNWAQYPQAVTTYTKLLNLQEKTLGADSEKLLPTLVALAAVAQNNTKNFSEVNATAETILKRAAEIATKKFGKGSKEEAAVLSDLSYYYHRRFDWERATKTCTLVIASDEKNFGPESTETMKALEHYALVLRAAGLRDKAEPIEARIAKIKGAKNTPDD